MQFLNITFLPCLSAAASTTAVVPLTNIYASLQSHTTDFNFAVLNSI